MTIEIERLKEFAAYCKILKGDEKGEAQVFCDRLFQAFGHKGYKEAGAILEHRVVGKASTKFADLLWQDRVLIEMKKRGAKLETHRSQAFDYWWRLRPNSPEFVILCNFDEVLIYKFSQQDEPVDKFSIEEILERYTALNFLFPVRKEPLFNNNLVDVTKSAARKVVQVFNRLINRGEDRARVQRFLLQIVFAMFAEDIGLLPNGFYSQILKDCNSPEDAFDLIGGLFRQMASPIEARGGRFKGVDYFNGGLFEVVDPVELNEGDLHLLKEASKENWKKVHPAIFGTIFQDSLGEDEQHVLGAHYTSEIDIYKIVYPTIVQPWRNKIEQAKTLKDIISLRREIVEFRVLDPACGSGNFLYVAYRELKRIEIDILNKIHQNFGPDAAKKVGTQTLLSPTQFYGMDVNFFAIELAKVTLLLAKELSILEAENLIESKQLGLQLQHEAPLPLDNLNNNLRCVDALFTDWPAIDVIIGNPPFQSKNKMQQEFGVEYVAKLRTTYPMIPGRADYCAYWFYKAHNVLPDNGFAGLVGTNTIRQNYTREGSLDYIVNNRGTIFNAVSSQEWSGTAVVFVSIVCWKKGEYEGKKLLYVEKDKGQMIEHKLDRISSSLSEKLDVTSAKTLLCNTSPKIVFQGQTHAYDGFLVSKEEAESIGRENPQYDEFLFPYLTGEEFISKPDFTINRYSIDFSFVNTLDQVARYPRLFRHLEQNVLPNIQANADKERSGKIKKNGREQHLEYWWKFWRRREDMLLAISQLRRYIVVPRVSKRPIFEFVSSAIHPNDALLVFAMEDDYSFGILQSKFHILWYHEKCSTLKGDARYTTESVWNTFPFPQSPSLTNIKQIAVLARDLRHERKKLMEENHMSLRDVYRLLEKPGKTLIREIHDELDNAVLTAYEFSSKKDELSQLLELNFSVSEKEKNGMRVQGPGIPIVVQDPTEIISNDCLTVL